MSTSELILIALIGAALALILTGRLRADLAALCLLLALSITGLISPQQAFAGFSSTAVITILSVSFLTAALVETGVIAWLTERFWQAGGGREGRLVFIFTAGGAFLSLFMNIIAAGAVLLPAAVSIARDSNIRASKLLIPLSFGTLIGATATYFTTANIILSTNLIEQGQAGLGLTSFIPTGVPILLAGLLYMILIGRRLLPERESLIQTATPRSLSRRLYETYQLEERLWEILVQPESWLVGVPISRSRIGGDLGLSVLAIWRGHHAILTPDPSIVIEAGDYLLVLGREDRIVQMKDWGVQIGRAQDSDLGSASGAAGTNHQYSVDLTEVIIPPRSEAIGKNLFDLRFRSKFGLTSVALWREGRSYRTDVGKFALQEGDALLMVGTPNKIRLLAGERDFLVLESSHQYRPPRPHKAPVALAVFVGALLIAIFGLLPTAEALLLGAVAVVITGCLNIDEAYRAVEWRVIFTIAGMLPISAALVNTGLAARISDLIQAVFAPYGALAVVAGVFLITMAVTQVVTGQVAALIMGPIAVTTALQLGLNPQAVAVAAATACSTAFLTPLAHPVNVLMMGSGGYKPSDFPRVGLGLAIVVFAVLMLMIALAWGVR